MLRKLCGREINVYFYWYPHEAIQILKQYEILIIVPQFQFPVWTMESS